MSTRQRVNELREALIDALGMKFSDEELAVLAGRLRFDSTRAISQQEVADAVGYSQPHISKVERNLLRRFKARADRRREASKGNKKLHDVIDDLKKGVATLEEVAGPRPLRLKKPISF